jgi:hypothetical protein
MTQTLIRTAVVILISVLIACGGSPPKKSSKVPPAVPKVTKIEFSSYPPSLFIDGVWQSEPKDTGTGVILTARLFFSDAGKKLGISLKCTAGDQGSPVTVEAELPAMYQGREKDEIVYEGDGSIQYGTAVASRVVTLLDGATKTRYSEHSGDSCSLSVKKDGQIKLDQRGNSMQVDGLITGMEKFSRIYKDE